MQGVEKSCSMVENLYNSNKKYLGSTALEFFERQITYDELFRNIYNVRKALLKKGVKKGDIVTVMPINTPEFIYLYYALNSIGAVINSIHPLSTEQEIENYIKESNTNLIFCSDVNCSSLNNVLKNSENTKINSVIVPFSNSIPVLYQLKNINNKQMIEKSKKLKSLMKNVLTENNKFESWDDFNKKSLFNLKNGISFDGKAEDVAVIVHTGGTTGVPKGVKLTNENGIALVENHKKGNINLNRNQSILGIISMYTAFGFFDNINVALSLGLKVILEPIYSPEAFIGDIHKYKPNILFCVPSFLEEFIDNELKKDNQLGHKQDFSNIDIIIIGGQKMSHDSLTKSGNFFAEHQPKKENKVRIDTGYGSSETCAALTCTIFDKCSNETVGKPFPYVNLKIVDLDTREVLPKNEVGEIIASGPTIMSGYYNMQEETEKALFKDNDGIIWYYTGDIGYINENGELDVIGRKRKMITMFNGYKIASPSIENQIETIEEVKDCVVVAIKDPNHPKGEVPKAYVSLRKNDYDKQIIIKKINDVIEKNMNERNKLYGIEFIDIIPTTKMGKKDFKMIEIMEMLNTLYKNVFCTLKKSENSNFDYDCEVKILENYNNSDREIYIGDMKSLIKILENSVCTKEASEGIKSNKRKSINYKLISDYRYVDDELKKNVNPKCKKLK